MLSLKAAKLLESEREALEKQVVGEKEVIADAPEGLRWHVPVARIRLI